MWVYMRAGWKRTQKGSYLIFPTLSISPHSLPGSPNPSRVHMLPPEVTIIAGWIVSLLLCDSVSSWFLNDSSFSQGHSPGHGIQASSPRTLGLWPHCWKSPLSCGHTTRLWRPIPYHASLPSPVATDWRAFGLPLGVLCHIYPSRCSSVVASSSHRTAILSSQLCTPPIQVLLPT